MIARLHGRVVAQSHEAVVVEVGGVGFEVRVPARLLEAFSSSSAEITLHTYLHVRENELTLYGFESADELSLFKLLLTVSGIGPRTAMTVLSHLTPQALRSALASGQTAVLAGIPGIGSKTAHRLVLELKDKVGLAEISGLPPALIAADAEVIAALTALGYSVVEAQRAVQGLPPDVTDIEERLRLALARSVR